MRKKVRTSEKSRADADSVDSVAGLLMHWSGIAMQRSRANGMPEMLALLNEHNLSMPMVVVVHLIAFEGKQTMTSLAEKTQLSTSATSHLIQRLVEGGIVERGDSPDDRRVKELGLTQLGSELVAAMMRQRFNELRASVQPLSEPTLGLLSKALRQVIDELQSPIAGGEGACPRPPTNGRHTASESTQLHKSPKEKT